jgi:hypothetical protein
LADRLEELGAPTDRATVARTENGTRGLSLDDALLYCAAVGAPFLSMVTITDNGAPVAVTPAQPLSPYDCRQWLRGNVPWRDEDERTYLTEVPDDEWVLYQKRGLRDMVLDFQRLLSALAHDLDVLPDNGETREQLIDRIAARLGLLRKEP